MTTQLRNTCNPLRKQYIGLGRFDEKGRKVGVLIVQWECDAVAVADDQSGYTQIEPGHYFFARVQPTRNGVSFGASQTAFYHRDLDRVTEWIKRRVDSTDRRYARKYGS